MVETADESLDRAELLSRRVDRLARELDRMEAERRRERALWARAASTLAGLAQPQLQGDLAEAARGMRQVAAAKRVELDRLEAAVDALGSALLAENDRVSGDPEKPAEVKTVSRAEDALAAAVHVLASLSHGQVEASLAQAVVGLKRAAAASPPDPAAIEAAVGVVKSALLNEEQTPAMAESWDVEREIIAAPIQRLAWSLGLSLLRGMRLGDATLDPQVEQVEMAIHRLMRTGEVDRPALALAADLMETFRHTLEERHQRAQLALEEIIAEMVRIQGELSASLSHGNERLLNEGEAYQARLAETVGQMTQEMEAAASLADLRDKAIGHLQGLRDEFGRALSRQREMVQHTQGELGRMRVALRKAARQMEAAKERRLKFARDALTDPLTGAWNRRALDILLSRMPAGSTMEPTCLMVFVINNFHSIAHQWGGAAADRALATISGQVMQVIREHDRLFRYTTDGFAVYMRATDLAMAQNLGEAVRQAIAAISFTYGDSGQVSLTATVVVAQVDPGEDGVSLLGRAEMYLDEAKQISPNAVVAAP